MRNYLTRTMVAMALTVCSHQVLATNQSSQPPDAAVSDVAVPQATVQRVHRFLEEFIDPHKTPSEQAALFAPDAAYYDQGVVGRARIAQDVRHYNRLWPSRAYRLVKVDSIIPDPDSDSALVRYEIHFKVARRAKAISGTAYYIALIANLDSAPKIAQIEEIITRRQTLASSGQ